jgi:uncharacterized membrane protein
VLPKGFRRKATANILSEVKKLTPVKIILTIIPFLWTIAMIPFANRVKPIVLGLPFLAFWLVAGIFVAFICLTILYKIDSKSNQGS